MTVERNPHPEPDAAWSALVEFVGKIMKMPDGNPPSPSLIKVVCFGAWIGCRLSVIFPPFALGVTEYGNAQSDDAIMSGTSKAFSDAYLPWLMANMNNYLHNMGFEAIGLTVLEDAVSESPGAGITDTDVLDIMKGLDDFGKGADGA